jgi:tRNA A-37 threonylcarbamoyl transferase component Bud32
MDIPGYTILGELGKGGMAEVYLAVQTSLDRQVALKLMAHSLCADEGFRVRFLAEGRLTAKLNHPHILTVHDIGEYRGRPYMATELLPGGSLKERLADQMPLADRLLALAQVAEGLAFAHRHQIVHRDVKPANVMFRDEHTAVVCDFGIAKALDGAASATVSGMIIGTAAYMSPEQARGTAVDHRADVYSFGVMLYECLLGEVPFTATDPFVVVAKQVTEPVPRLPVPLTRYQRLVDSLMAKDAAARPPSLIAVAAELRQMAASVDVVIEAKSTAILAAPAPLASPADVEPSAPRSVAAPAAIETEIVPRSSRVDAGPKPLRLSRLAVVIGLPLAIMLALYGWLAGTDGSRPGSVAEPTQVNGAGAAKLPDSVEALFASNGSADSAPAQMASVAPLQPGAEQVRGAIAARRYFDPPGASAYDAIERMLTAQPTDRVALGLLQDLSFALSEDVRAASGAGRTVQAFALLQRALQRLPNHPALRELEAELLPELDVVDPALPAQVDELAGRSVTELLELADARFAAGQISAPEQGSAVQILRVVLARDPRQPQATAKLRNIARSYEQAAQIWVARGRPDQAMSMLDRALLAEPDNSDVRRLRDQLKGQG